MLNPETSSNHKQSSTFTETLQDKLKDIKNFSDWSAKEQVVAVTTVGVIFGALLPVVAVALPVAPTVAAIALTLFFAVKVVEYGYKGLKWSAEKTWEGAKYTAGKIKAGAAYVKDSAKEATNSLKQATRDGTGSALKKMGEGVQNLGRKMSDRGASISDLESMPYSIELQEPQGVVLLAKRELNPDLIDNNGDLERDSLQSNSLSRSSSTNSVNTDGSTTRLVNPEEHKNAPTSAKDKVLPWFRRNKEEKGATKVKYQVLSEPGTILPVTVNRNNFSRSPSSSNLYDDPPVLTPIVPPKAPGSPTSSRDSGINSPSPSGSSTPENLSFILYPNSLDKSRLKKTGHLDKLVPSTKVGDNIGVQHQTTPKSVA